MLLWLNSYLFLVAMVTNNLAVPCLFYFFFSLSAILVLAPNIRTSYKEVHNWPRDWWNRDILQQDWELLLGNSMVVIMILLISMVNLCHTWQKTSLSCVWNRLAGGHDGCHMWGRRCSPFPEHLMSPLWRFVAPRVALLITSGFPFVCRGLCFMVFRQLFTEFVNIWIKISGLWTLVLFARNCYLHGS